MRRMAVAAVILFLIISLCLYESGRLEKVYQSNLTELEKIETYIEKNSIESAKDKFSTVKKQWTQDEETLGYITSHEDTDAVNILMTELGENIRQENTNGCLMTIEKLRLQFEHIYKRNKIRISNIL